MTESEISYIKLCAIKDIGAVTARRLLEHFGSPEAVFAANKDELLRVEKIGAKTAESLLAGRDSVDVSKIADAMARIGARYVSYKNPNYPKQLAQLPDKPIGLYCIGEADLSAPCISIVGSRNCTVYGQLTARKFAAEFARAGYTVVSGMARGIDAMAHLGALEAGGKTIAVLGSGVDVVYPPENFDLYKKIAAAGAAVSEFPMGTRADRQNFPIRNRIVAGLSAATVVIESDIKGGSMITARIAGEYGRDVFAVPGRIDSSLSRGCNALIKDGAFLAESAADVIDALNFARPVQPDLFDAAPARQAAATNRQPAQKRGQPVSGNSIHSGNGAPQNAPLPKPAPALAGDELALFRLIEREKTIHVDAIAELSGMGMKRCLPVLLMLEIKRLVGKDAGGNWSLKGN